MIYFGYPLDIHGWKTKPETEPDWFRSPEPENRGWKIIPNPNPQNPKPADIRPKPDPLPSLIHKLMHELWISHPKVAYYIGTKYLYLPFWCFMLGQTYRDWLSLCGRTSWVKQVDIRFIISANNQVDNGFTKPLVSQELAPHVTTVIDGSISTMWLNCHASVVILLFLFWRRKSCDAWKLRLLGPIWTPTTNG